LDGNKRWCRRADRRLDPRPVRPQRFYTWDLLLYVLGILWIIAATQTWMLVAGYMIIGLAVGNDVPASWTLIAEIAPAQRRGRLGGRARPSGGCPASPEGRRTVPVNPHSGY
jgi:MFS family permease